MWKYFSLVLASAAYAVNEQQNPPGVYPYYGFSADDLGDIRKMISFSFFVEVN